MLLAETELSETGKILVAALSGGTLASVGAWILKLVVERRQSKVVATSDSIKRDRAKLGLEQDKLDRALENQQRAYDDLYTKFLELYKRADSMQELLLRSEVERAIAVTKLSECVRQAGESQRRIEYLESKVHHAD